ncbi:hypothetical protein MP228_002107 [Amoeboaphelidium protococcarum]|nr:hypothetical protein MP228_002107 [Amoeboaphelidium protococcarum]
MTGINNKLQAIVYDQADHSLRILDQLQLPHKSVYVSVSGIQDGFDVIKSMKVRGAPAIAIVAMMSLAVEVHRQEYQAVDATKLLVKIKGHLDYIVKSRPTAVNLFEAANRLRVQLSDISINNAQELILFVEKFAIDLYEKDIQDCRAMGGNGADWLISQCQQQGRKLRVLTHCNTGSLATGGYGTALGVIRRLNELGHLEQVFCTETRPYNQGSRLTAYELVTDSLPQPTLICDNMVSSLFQTAQQKFGGPIDAIIVGADRVAANGDTANKIGTYQLAIAARYHGVKFMVVAPSTTVDLNTQSGSDIQIEERPHKELTHVTGLSEDGELQQVNTAPKSINVWNPAFDVTPHELIDCIVTESQVFVKDAAGKFNITF